MCDDNRLSIAIIANHCDDISLSIGATVASYRANIDGYIFFTKSSYMLTGYMDQKYVTKLRKREEEKAAKILNYKPIFLDFPDDSIGPKTSKKDIYENLIINQLKEIIDKNYSLLFVPLGIGYHNDHIFLNQTLNKVLTSINISKIPNTLFYEDLPYAAETEVNISSIRRKLFNDGYVKLTGGYGYWSFKKRALLEYKSQIDKRIIKMLKRECMVNKGEILWIKKNGLLNLHTFQSLQLNKLTTYYAHTSYL